MFMYSLHYTATFVAVSSVNKVDISSAHFAWREKWDVEWKYNNKKPLFSLIRNHLVFLAICIHRNLVFLATSLSHPLFLFSKKSCQGEGARKGDGWLTLLGRLESSTELPFPLLFFFSDSPSLTKNYQLYWFWCPNVTELVSLFVVCATAKSPPTPTVNLVPQTFSLRI